jgi:hypothetical protein
MPKPQMDVRAYYKNLFRSTWDATWGAIGSHVRYSVAVLIGAVLLGFFGARSESVSDIAGAVVTVILVLVAFFVYQFFVAPVRLAAAAGVAADEGLREANGQLAAANDRLAEIESEPVSEAHRTALQRVAGTMLAGVQRLAHAYYLDMGEPDELASAFREHFGDVASEVDRWNTAIAQLESARDRLRIWLQDAVAVRGFDGSPFQAVSMHVGREAESDEPEMQFGTVAGHLQARGQLIMDLTLVAEHERESKVQGLRDLLSDAVATDERTEVTAALQVAKLLQGPLEQALKGLRAKAVIRGKCALCR